ncbi:MAG: exopolyphosphatase [Bergeyella sp.]|nr:exopolyphosphatase [Bergeyella sp.]
MRIAAIDIGSNAARLLISEVKENSERKPEFIRLNLLRVPLRLGMDVFVKGKIEEERKKMFIDTMKTFGDLMKIYKVTHYRACATSAMREASNGKKVRDEIKKNSGINIEIISGEAEATLIYENHFEETLDKSFTYLYIDVGGGSTEFTLYEEGRCTYQHSFDIGTIRVLNNLVTEKSWNKMKQEIKAQLADKKNTLAIGSGGNINKLFSLSRQKDGRPVSLLYLKKNLKEMRKLTVEERMIRYKLREDRADVLVPALIIYTQVLSWAKVKEIYIPKISLTDGLIYNIYSHSEKAERLL